MRRFKAFTAIAVLVSLLMGEFLFWPCSALYAKENDKIIHISTVDDLKKLEKNCRKDRWSAGRIIVLDNDIELSDNTSIVLASFAGTFDGKGHSIKNAGIAEVAQSTGFFGIIFKQGFVQNLNIEGSLKPEDRLKCLGGIAGKNYGRIENCSFNGLIRAVSNVGGIAGQNMDTGLIKNCRASGIVQGDSCCGGICGKNEGRIEDCVNEAKINTKYEDSSLTKEELVDAIEIIMMGEDLNELRGFRARMDAGGIAGFTEGEISGCTNKGKVGYEHVGYNTGGIAGRSTGLIRSCTNRGSVLGRKDVGGIVGQQQPFLAIDFTEGDLGELDKMVSGLGDSVNSTLTDVSGYSVDTTRRLLEISALTDQAVDDIDGMAEIAHKGADKLSNTATDTIDMARVSVDDLDEYLEEVLSALDDLDDEIQDKDSESQLTTSEKSELHNTIEEIKSTLTNTPSGRERLDRISSYFNNLLDMRNAARKGVVETLTLIERLAGVRDGSLADAIDDLNDALQDENDVYDDIMEVLDTTETYNNRASELNESLDNAGSQLYARLGQITDQVNEALVGANADVQGTVSSLKDIQVKSDDIRQKINDMLHKAMDPDFYTEERTEDISSLDVENAKDGRTSTSFNYGSVSGDTNVGGITGTMGIEVDLDPEGDIEKNGRNSFNYVLRTKCVLDRSENRGEIHANRNVSGGIVGRMELGLALSNISYGDVFAADDFAGGICGYSTAEITGCSAKQYVEANRYAGGIAGYGQKLSGCVSMSCIGGASAYVGAICGSAQEVTASDIHDNYYYAKELYGIDGVSYKGIAEFSPYKKLVAMPGVPGDFSDIILTFVADDDIVGRVSCRYGKGLSNEEIPKVPEKDGFSGSWDKESFDKITADERINVKYKRIETLIKSDARRKGKQPVLLAEGLFVRGDELSLSEEAPTGKYEKARFKVKVPDDGEETHTFRYLPVKKDQITKIRLYEPDGSYRTLKSSSFGKYVVFEANGNEFTFASVEYWKGLFWAVIAGIIVFFITGTVIFVIRFRKGKILLQRFIRWLSAKVEMKRQQQNS